MAKIKTENKIKTEKMAQSKSENVMRNIRIDKVVLNVGGTADTLDKGFRLLKFLTKKKPAKIKSKKRIPTWGVRPGLEVGAVVTLRKDFMEFLNPDSMKILQGKVEPGMANAKPGEQYQFERKGFFCVDPDSAPAKPVFNLTVSLRDTWAKIESGLKSQQAR